MSGDQRRKEYAEDFTAGLDELPEAVLAYMREQRQFWRQVRSDDGPEPER